MPERAAKLAAAMTGLAVQRQMNRALPLGKDMPCNRRRPKNHGHRNAQAARTVDQSSVPTDDNVAARKHGQ